MHFYPFPYILSTTGKKYHCSTGINTPLQPGSVLTLDVLPNSYPRLHKSDLRCRNMSFVKRIRPDLNWTMICKQTYPYYIGMGKSSIAKCRACGYQYERDELRVRTQLVRKLGKCYFACEVNMCMRLKCIKETFYKSWVRW